MQESYKHISVHLTDNNGKLIVGKGSANVLSDTSIIHLIHTAAKYQKIITSDLMRTASTNHLHLSILSPLLNNSGKTIAVLLVQINPEAEFYPFIETWPARSRTAETMIIKKTGDSVLYLSRLKYKLNSQHLFTIPLSRAYIPAVQAVLGYSGEYQGPDYRGVQVISVIRALSFNNWHLIVKKDRSEILDELFSKAVVIALIVMLLIFISSLLLLYRNISVQRRAAAKLHAKELELLKSQAIFKSTMDCLVDGVIITDKDSRIVYMNNSAVELTGFQKSDASHKQLNQIYQIKNEITGEIVFDVVGKIKKMGGLKELANHTLLITKDGHEIPISDAGSPIMNGDNSFHGVVLTFRNEIEKRHQQHLLEESEERLRSTLENLIEGCQIVGFDWKYQYLNKAAIAFSRQPLDDLIGRTIQECYPGFGDTAMYRALNKSMTERVYNEFEDVFVYPDGSKAWFRLLIQPVPKGLFIMSSDVTEQKKAEEALYNSNERYRILVDNTPDLIYSLDLQYKHTSVNKSFCQAFKKNKEEILGKDYDELGFLPEQAQNWFKLLQQVKQTNTTATGTVTLAIPDGNVRTFEVVLIPILNGAGNLTGIRGVNRDITEKLATERKLNESLQSFQMVLKGVDAGTWIWFFADNYVEFNKRYHEILGYEPHELSNDVNSITGLVHPEDMTHVQNLLQQHIEGKVDFLAFDIRMKHKSGKWIWVSTRGKIIERDNTGNPVKMSGIAIDITEQKLVAEALRASHLRYKHLISELTRNFG
ncbi:MAG: PAS domain S-box protein [Ignavibacteriales bacterium]|nr:PAS domain S-box protein [Ignavibacteriales bacterium]